MTANRIINNNRDNRGREDTSVRQGNEVDGKDLFRPLDS